MKNRNAYGLDYRKTKMGSIPPEWHQSKISEIVEINPRKCQAGADTHVTFLAMSDISDDGKILGGTQRRYSEVCNGYTAFAEGDVLIAKITPCFENGKGFIARNLINGLGFGSTEFHVLRPRESIDRWFLYYHTVSRAFRKRGKSNMVGTAGQKRVPKDFIESYLIPLPPIHEQKKIGDILSTWDKAIDQTSKFIEAKKRHKKAIMQQLLSGTKRFNSVRRDEWRVRPLSELVEPVSRPEPKPPKPYLSIGVRSHGKGTFQKIVEFPEKVFMDTLYRVESRDLIVNITFAWEGAIAIATEQDTGGLVSHRFPTYRLKEKEVNIDFFRNLIQTKRFVRDLGLISPGGAGRNRVLNQKDFLKLRVPVPSMEIQTEIAKILTATSDEINLSESYLDALRRQKSGLIQKLLTGEIRVKI
jgi:type I restriction enzyme S subunit